MSFPLSATGSGHTCDVITRRIAMMYFGGKLTTILTIKSHWRYYIVIGGISCRIYTERLPFMTLHDDNKLM
jgi:hypothetical protein